MLVEAFRIDNGTLNGLPARLGHRIKSGLESSFSGSLARRSG
jgi:hypothetical protein